MLRYGRSLAWAQAWKSEAKQRNCGAFVAFVALLAIGPATPAIINHSSNPSLGQLGNPDGAGGMPVRDTGGSNGGGGVPNKLVGGPDGVGGMPRVAGSGSGGVGGIPHSGDWGRAGSIPASVHFAPTAGLILDSTNAPISGAPVLVFACDGTLIAATTTDELGGFVLTLPKVAGLTLVLPTLGVDDVPVVAGHPLLIIVP
jgi:hypothetical protein